MNRLKELRENHGMKQSELGKLLNVQDAAISKYESGKVPLTADTIIRLAEIFEVSTDYLLGREDLSGQGLDKEDIEEQGLDSSGITEIFGYNNNEEKIITFSNKLSYQIDCNSAKIADIAKEIGVSETTVLKWLDGTDNSYANYYEKLSEYFETGIRYWTSPSALSPTIEPNTEEYLLIMTYRNYKKNGVFNKYLGSLEHYFPGVDIINNAIEKKFLSVIRQLDEDNTDILLGKAKELLKEQRYEETNRCNGRTKRGKIVSLEWYRSNHKPRKK